MNLRDLRYLVALAEHRHFGRAAQACFVSQPTLSTQIKKLEDELGVALVERAPRKVLLTEIGETVAARARVILREVDEIRALARQKLDPEAGTLRLGVFPTLAPYLLPHVMPRLNARFPRLQLLLVEEKTPRLERQLHEGRLDAALLALPVSDEQLHTAFLFEEPFMLAVPAAHRLAAHTAVRLKDLAEERLMLLEDGHCLREQALAVCHRAGAGERDGFRATSLETLRQMVAANVGITLLPLLAVQPPVPQSPAIAVRPFADVQPSRRIALVWRRSSAMGPFLERVAAVLRELPDGLLDASAWRRVPRPAAAARRRGA